MGRFLDLAGETVRGHVGFRVGLSILLLAAGCGIDRSTATADPSRLGSDGNDDEGSAAPGDGHGGGDGLVTTGAGMGGSQTLDGSTSVTTADAAVDTGGALDAGADAAVELMIDAGPLGPIDAQVVDGTCRGFMAPGEDCPSECSSCDDDKGICNIDCTLPFACSQSALQCPSGWACEIDCSTLNACNSVEIICSDGPCRLVCAGLGNCGNVTLRCGADACMAECAGITGGNFVLDPGISCAPVNNGCL